MNAQHTLICFFENKTNHRNKRTQTLAPRTLWRPVAMRSESGGAGWHAHIWSPLFSLRAARFAPCNVASIVLSRSLMPTTCDYPFHGDYVEAVSKVHFGNFSSHATNCRMMPSEGTLHKEQQACLPTLAPMTTSGGRSAMQKKVVLHIVVGKVEQGAGQDSPRQVQGLQVIHVDMKEVDANCCFRGEGRD